MEKTNSHSLYFKLSTFVHDLQRSRGLDVSETRDIVLVLFFLRFLSSTSNHGYYDIPEECDFNTLCAVEKYSLPLFIGNLIKDLELRNSSLEGIGMSVDHLLIDRSSHPEWVKFVQEICDRLASNDFDSAFNVDPKFFQKCFLFLVESYSDFSGKKAGEFYSPNSVADLIINLLKPQQGMSIYDPVCGSGGFLTKAADFIEKNGGRTDTCKFVGQELSVSSLVIAKLNLLIHGISNAELYSGDVITNPGSLDSHGDLEKFDIVLADPPFSMKNWCRGDFQPLHDIHHRFEFGIPPASNADFAFVLHTLYSLKEGGKAAVIVSDGVLFRAGAEGKIRQKLIEAGHIHAVISLPPNLFPGTGISANILVLSNPGSCEDVLFIKSSHSYESQKKRNILTEGYIASVVSNYDARDSRGMNSYRANVEEIASKKFNLRVSSYIKEKYEDTKERSLSIVELIDKQENLEKELELLQGEMSRLLSRIK
ncbi:N-6 DNA methylase [uncultured Amphritea sp.]|uniref:HsdM family class I SAM-dependent methyltransferase n=1 Tax=uncultured Amphritea sp. TaxID=981605 RepID=UPI002637FFE0|nr:N-6 DNA methylase [uncultured Amphritea sp.]